MKAGAALLCLMFLGKNVLGQAARLSVNELSQEVAALEVLHQFQFTPSQLKILQHLAPNTADVPGPRTPPKVSEAYRQTLQQLHAALLAGKPAERIAELQDRLDELREKESPELDDGFDLTEAAIEQAPKLLKELSARQVANYLALYGDAFPDPLELLLAAIEKARSLKEAEWKELRETIAEEIGRLVGGLDTEKCHRVGSRAVELLIQARSMKEEEFTAQRGALEKTARDLIGSDGPLDVVRKVLEQALAELLSNPRLGPALAGRLAGR